MDTNTSIFYVAAVGSDGRRPVVWGTGYDSDLETAEQMCREDSKRWLAEADEETDMPELFQIDQETYSRIIEGEIDAEDLDIV